MTRLARRAVAADSWTTDKLEKLRRLYPDTPNPVVAKKIGMEVSTIVAKASALGLTKSRKFLAKLRARLRK